METILNQVENYWTGRSDGYCQSNLAELTIERETTWKELIHEHAPQSFGAPLKVLDVGTGPGFLVLVMAGCGHEVTAVDYTEAMLEQARGNATDLGLKITCRKMDAQNLDFEDNVFDLVLTRNLTWNLEQPDKAYQEFFRVLRPGGKLLNFDANWYLYLYDPESEKAYARARDNAKKLEYADHHSVPGASIMEDIARNLPLSRVIRPQWDVEALTDAGFNKVTIDPEIGDLVWNEMEKVNYASTPMFMIAAEK